MHYEDLDELRLVLILVSENPNGEEEWHLVHGILRQSEEGFYLDRGAEHKPFPILRHWIDRIRPVTEETASILEPAEFSLLLTIGPLPEDADPAEFLATGLRLT